MASFEVDFTTLSALVSAEKHFPPRTPKRWKLVAEYVSKLQPKKPHTVSSVGPSIREPNMILGHSIRTPIKFQCSA